MARQRLMATIGQKVPKADVVVVNPTHFAIALRYNKVEADAPIVVAKGVDFLAMRIRILADQHDIPIVENPPLARGLYFQTLEGQQIPPDFYAAVAEVLAVIYRRRNHKEALPM
jgi:flagellar biosynthetic protein FlhB